MINSKKRNYQKVAARVALYSKYPFILTLPALLFLSSTVLFAAYFQELAHFSHEQLARSLAVTITLDDRYFITIEGGENSTIQVYERSASEHDKSLIKLVSATSEDYRGNKLLKLGALLTTGNNQIYTLSERYQNDSQGCLLSVYSIENDGQLSPKDELFIKSTDSPPFHKHITGANDQMFISCQTLLVAVHIDQKSDHLLKKDTLKLDEPDFYPVSLAYSTELNLLYLLFSSVVTTGKQPIGRAYAYHDDKLKMPRDLLIGINPMDTSFYTTRVILYSPRYLLICLSYEEPASIITNNSPESLQPHSDNAFDMSIYVTDFILSRFSRRLFYASVNKIGALHINSGGEVKEISGNKIDINVTYQKLALANDGCHLLAMAQRGNYSRNGSLTFFRINDPAIGCDAAGNSNLIEEICITTLGLVSIATVVLVTTYSCYRLWKWGARKGYTPVGHPDY